MKQYSAWLGKNLGTYNVQTLSETAESTRHYITFSTLPKNCTQEYPYQDHTNSPVIRQREVPIFPQGQQSERNASARENHPTRERREAAVKEKNEGLQTEPKLLTLCVALTTRNSDWLSLPWQSVNIFQKRASHNLRNKNNQSRANND